MTDTNAELAGPALAATLEPDHAERERWLAAASRFVHELLDGTARAPAMGPAPEVLRSERRSSERTSM